MGLVSRAFCLRTGPAPGPSPEGEGEERLKMNLPLVRRTDRRSQRPRAGGAGRRLRLARPQALSHRDRHRCDQVSRRQFLGRGPRWGAGRGGTRFAKFPIAGEPTNIHEKLEDCAVIHQLCRVTPRVSPHFPWDKVGDYAALREEAADLGLGFDAVNSNTFQDQPGQAHTYATGSLASTLEATRQQAVEHNIECIEIGRQLGSRDLTVWIGDGTNFPGQQDFARSLDRYLEAAAQVYAALPDGWRMLIEHKMFEPAFYSSVISDWGSSILAAQELGPKAKCLVDLGHHAPNTNIEQIVARLHRFGKLGGFHFNDSKYGDDDLDSGSINPHQLFLVFNELVEAELNPSGRLRSRLHDRPVAQRHRSDRIDAVLRRSNNPVLSPRPCWSIAKRCTRRSRPTTR